MKNSEHEIGARPRSAALYERACRVIPGGVNSPVRAFRAVGGTPLFIARGAGQHLFDADGRGYLDFVNSWGALILGHAHPAVVAAITDATKNGTTFGAPCAGEVELAERIVASYPALEQVRFVSSGTEAVMSAIRLARAFTGRDLIVKFSGCYHGHADHLLVAAGSGLATFGRPSSAGVPEAFTACTRVLPLDDEAAVKALFDSEGARIAAVIIEPVPANHGLLLQRREFLESLRRITTQHGTLLIFDEVISGFRLARGGVSELVGIVPDLATFGKVIGGGMPVGAYGGRADLMQQIAPSGPIYQAGTLSGNPVAMAAGLATLELIQAPGFHAALEARTHQLCDGLEQAAKEAGVPVTSNRSCAMFGLFFTDRRVETYADATACDVEAFKRFFHGMLRRGVYLAPSAYEAGFLSSAHGDIEIAHTIEAAREAFREARN